MNTETTKNKNGFWTLRYSLLNAAYFVAFCTIHAMAAVYLIAQGFTNTQIGVLLAIANISSAILQPVFASIIDKPGPLTNRRFILGSAILIFAGSLMLYFSGGHKAVIFILYALIYMIQFTYQPVMTALCFEYQKAGCSIQFGLARGIGSASFAVTSLFIGRIIEKEGAGLLLIIDMIVMLASAVLIYAFKLPDRKDVSALPGTDVDGTEDNSASQEKAHSSLREFFQTYPAFTVYLVAVICFFFAHNMINDFMIRIITNLGGSEAQLGYANFLQAILELPVMALIGFVFKKISAKSLLIVTGTAFFVKILILVFAVNMAGMFFSQFFQLFAYAVFVPATAFYVNDTMDTLDQVKGQAYVTSAITIGGVFSNLISGSVLDHFGIRAMLITGTAVCGVGVLIAFYAIQKLPHHC
ncbi:MAG: MFS transporter [Lachnospiraceae bacterium]|nr:MFS transporter [Lachnospiraceae bacterium]